MTIKYHVPTIAAALAASFVLSPAAYAATPDIPGPDTLAAGSPLHVDVSNFAGVPVPLSIPHANTCTLAAVIDDSTALTAGHCGQAGDTVYLAADGEAGEDGTTSYDVTKDRRIGEVRASQMGNDIDAAVVTLDPDLSDRGIDLSVSRTRPLSDLDRGDTVHKVGATTGVTTGQLESSLRSNAINTWSFATLPGNYLGNAVEVNGYDVSLCARPGDSGGPLFDEAGNVVGILSGGQASACHPDGTPEPAHAVTIVTDVRDALHLVGR